MTRKLTKSSEAIGREGLETMKRLDQITVLNRGTGVQLICPVPDGLQ